MNVCSVDACLLTSVLQSVIACQIMPYVLKTDTWGVLQKIKGGSSWLFIMLIIKTNRDKHWHVYIFFVCRWKSFKRHMLTIRSHSDAKGFELKRPNDSIYSFPCPDCMCRVNKTEDSRSSSATWSDRREIWMVFVITVVSSWTHWAADSNFCVLRFFHFFLTLSTWWESIHFNFGSSKDFIGGRIHQIISRDRKQENCIVLYMMLENTNDIPFHYHELPGY